MDRHVEENHPEVAPKHTTEETLTPLRVAILRNISTEVFESELTKQAKESGFSLDIDLGTFDNIVQDALSPSPGLIRTETNAIAVFLHLEQISSKICNRLIGMSSGELEAEINRIVSIIDMVSDALRKRSSAPIIWASFETMETNALGAGDLSQRDGLRQTVLHLNNKLIQLTESVPNFYLLDTVAILMKLGRDDFYDQRLWNLMSLPYSMKAMREISRDFTSLMRSLIGKQRKCVVVDCDETLWGGIVGEDGFSGLTISPNATGKVFFDFQRALVNLHDRGVLVALASKNNPEDVWEVFDKRPDMPLRKEHVVASRINWQDKTSNLRDLAASLNLGLDSFVFIDDSEFEIDLVRHILPEVACILVDASNPGGHARQLADSRHFDTLSVTEQDRKRTASYKAEERRIEIRNSTESLTGYLKSLGMNLEIKRASTDTLNRLSQLTMRTNQFNLTTKRYSERDIAALSESSSHELLQISLTDRFGEYGIIGTAILAHEPFATTVDNFLLSCRALGRGVEYAAFADICKRAKLQGMETLKSTYIATKKNQQTEDFYLRAGMKLECETEGKKEFTLDLNFAIKSQEDQHLAIYSDAQSKEDT